MHHVEALPDITSHRQLLMLDAARDVVTCGISLANGDESDLKDQGAHDPTPTYYFILEELFSNFHLSSQSHLLDVGCATGRVIAYWLEQNCPGRITGIELDERLATKTKSWAWRKPGVKVISGDVLDLDLNAYTDCYLFNPFDQAVLVKFIERIEEQLTHPLTIVHMSDNGDTLAYLGRPGWTLVKEDWFYTYGTIAVYACPQHYSVWSYDPFQKDVTL